MSVLFQHIYSILKDLLNSLSLTGHRGVFDTSQNLQIWVWELPVYVGELMESESKSSPNRRWFLWYLKPPARWMNDSWLFLVPILWSKDSTTTAGKKVAAFGQEWLEQSGEKKLHLLSWLQFSNLIQWKKMIWFSQPSIWRKVFPYTMVTFSMVPGCQTNRCWRFTRCGDMPPKKISPRRN